MKNRVGSKILESLCLFVLGGLLYNGIELIWRRYTHWSMFLVGGACFQMIGRIHCRLQHRRLAIRCLLSSCAVTVIEFFSGCLFNLHLKMQVWNYEKQPFNILGQVCLLYSALWGLLSIPAGWLYRRCSQRWQRRFGCHALPADGHK